MGWIGNAGETRSVLRRLVPTCLCYTPAPPIVNRASQKAPAFSPADCYEVKTIDVC